MRGRVVGYLFAALHQVADEEDCSLVLLLVVPFCCCVGTFTCGLNKPHKSDETPCSLKHCFLLLLLLLLLHPFPVLVGSVRACVRLLCNLFRFFVDVYPYDRDFHRIDGEKGNEGGQWLGRRIWLALIVRLYTYI